MKKLLLTMLGVVGMLCSTSCSDEEIVASVEGEAMVQFTVELEGAGASRAEEVTEPKISDGTTVNTVYYEVFSNITKNGVVTQTEIETLKGEASISGKKATVNLALVKGQTYDIVFWASKAGVYNTSDLTNIAVNEGLANDEEKDAFTAKRTYTVTGPIKETVELTRPFAQINFGTLLTDMQAAEAAGAKLTVSKIEVTNVADYYNALSEEGCIVGKEAQTVEFGYKAIPNREKQELTFAEGVTPTYEYLATAYVLFPGKATDQVTTDLTMTVPTELNQEVVLTVPTAPAQRNFRTNILGNLLTNQAVFEVVVDPSYVGDYVENVDKTETVSTAAELQAAIDAAIEGNNIITFGADITGDVIVPQNEGINGKAINIVINGAGYKYDGQIEIHGKSDFATKANLTIYDVNFETSTSGQEFIWSYDQNAPVRYAHNVTIKNCTFTATGEAVHTAVGAKFLQAKDILMTDCTATGMHTIFQSESCGNNGTITINNVETVNCKNSVSFNNTQNATISNSKLQSVGEDGYGVRVKGENAGYGLRVDNCEISAAVPVLVRNMTAKGYTIAFEGNNVLTTNKNYQVVISNADYSLDKSGNWLPLVTPTGTYTLTGADGFVVYPRDNAVSTEDELIAALKAKASAIKLTNNITVTTKWDNRNTGGKTSTPIVIDGNNHTLKFTGEVNDGLNYHSVFRFENSAVVKNLTMDMSEVAGTGSWLRAISSKADISVDNCTFIGSDNYTKDNAVVVGDENTSAQLNYTASITNCTFTNWRRGVSDNENAKEVKSIVVDGNTFTNAPAYLSAYEYIQFTNNVMNNSLINITSYTNAANTKVKAIENTLDANQNNVIGGASKVFSSANVECQEGFVVNAK